MEHNVLCYVLFLKKMRENKNKVIKIVTLHNRYLYETALEIFANTCVCIDTCLGTMFVLILGFVGRL
jgi:hypothetical protein